MGHPLKRCLMSKNGWRIGESDFIHHDSELCEQMYFDDIGYGLNGKMPALRRKTAARRKSK